MKVNMTDLEITKLCAQAMGLSLENDADSRMSRDMLMFYEGKTYHVYDPLHDDAQAMALVKKLHMTIVWGDHVENGPTWYVDDDGVNADLNRAIVECVAKMQAAK